jgi:hypothetical protein
MESEIEQRAQALYASSQQRGSVPSKDYSECPPGMSHRAFSMACRNGFGTRAKGLDFDRLKSAIDDGTIWFSRMIGKRCVAEYCRWIAKEEDARSV